MTAVFVVCAAVGGTLLVWQLTMTLLGLGGHEFHGDVGGGDFSDADFGHAVGGAIGHAGDFHTGDTADAGHADAAHSADDAAAHHGPSWLAGVISFRTLVAAVTFFGLAGLAAQSAEASSFNVLAVALAAGVAAMYGVYWIMRGMYQLRCEGNVRLSRAVGLPASVYLRVPAHNTGLGKIQINLQNRTMEYLASTAGEEIPTGAAVTVVSVIDANTVAVQACNEPERNHHERSAAQ